ncbi:malto-oligosyltrehalose trehalohydrolase [Nocardioides sp. TRM66260-LWL]|uniref:malto-oligosyltrehalose trehalohydrolase n=1 Tax=Nocardioides sp. TRM66260-LWL TaxID=2874478 RepID=UPI001CC64FA6|nr:malto-oligosyltrehalose trehalohydrolase [Nocardioides sp. TRM66260-LWL]MBZ5733760.1 malto-oligosyltrehalose trehalohydrolase [Nocardioides sp. TRM66260-LWL]
MSTPAPGRPRPPRAAGLLSALDLATRPDPRSTHATRPVLDVWGPRPERVRLLVRPAGGAPGDPGERIVPMARDDAGWWTPDTPAAELLAGGELDYGYLLDGEETPRPDPRSRRQPDGVHGLSRTVDPSAFPWTDHAWTGRPLAGSVVYELHVGTFTPEGTLDAAIGRLGHLVSLGVDLVELLPVNAVNGTHNWGYDGVGWFAVSEAYGGPEAYARFVDAAHGAGLGVIQDVVHNHLGPSGNYLPLFGPYLKDGRSTWGDLVNLDGDGSDEVRRLILDDAAMFALDLHVDGLRLDAVHALRDASPRHLLEELAVETDALAAHLRRPLTLIAESDLNDPRLVTPREAGGLGLHAQWSDDVHHALHVAITGETDGYYADFADPGALPKVMTRGFLHDGTWSSFRGRPHGVPIDTATTPAWRFVVTTQNHDQVGNRAVGDRPDAHLDEGLVACSALLLLTSPFTPMLFQGQEWAASTPFCFFTSHPEPELGKATAEGRLAEFEAMGWDPDVVPDPQDPATFERSRLDWRESTEGRHARTLERYRALIALRRARPELTDPSFVATTCTVDDGLVRLGRGPTTVLANLGDAPVTVPVGDAALLLATQDDVRLADGELVLPAHAGAVVGD